MDYKKLLKSIEKQCCVKDFKGYYFYKGFTISNGGGDEYPWNYGIDIICGYECAKTMKEAKKDIDYVVENMTIEQIKELVKKELFYDKKIQELL